MLIIPTVELIINAFMDLAIQKQDFKLENLTHSRRNHNLTGQSRSKCVVKSFHAAYTAWYRKILFFDGLDVRYFPGLVASHNRPFHRTYDFVLEIFKLECHESKHAAQQYLQPVASTSEFVVVGQWLQLHPISEKEFGESRKTGI